MDRNFYRFRSQWWVGAAPRATYGVLERFDAYPDWWPEVRRLRLIEEECCQVTCRSFLPYDLTFVLRPARRDPLAGVLEASMAGDLDGFSRWTLTAAPGGTQVVFEEEVEVTKRLLRLLDPVARPLLRANHGVMMRHARTGLARRLVAPGSRPMGGAAVRGTGAPVG